ncbi:MAG: fumarate hydratase [Candidatus Omnitrophota bacterium]
MKTIRERAIRECVRRLSLKANFSLRPDVKESLKRALAREKNPRARRILADLLENARIARRDSLALCQDTGMPVVFLEIGPDVNISGIDVQGAVRGGIAEAYREGFLRDSIIPDPLLRGRPGFSPGIVHANFSRQKGLKITVMPKGFGCENKTRLKMLVPTAGPGEVEDFVISAVHEAGPDACPPYVIGVGIGGTSDYACQMAKEALLRPLNRRSGLSHVARLENSLMKKLNKINLGPMGLGGSTSVLGVNISTYPTHIAGLPVCVNISCHVLRSASERL